ncbi:MAG: right-handed parallel beta-helix repeat-containing protein [Bryobacterales bacterium]|nr:right-handed parallel beta-helix repeat-containing protein [Bryobacterales bacterium]
MAKTFCFLIVPAMLFSQTLPAPFDKAVAYSRTLHVSTAGTASGDGSANAPFDTIQRAVRAATPGTRILVRAGAYRGAITLSGLKGEPGKPVALTAEGAVELDAAGAGTILSGSDLRYVVIEGFTLRGATVHAINIDDGGSYETPTEHLVLRGLTIAGSGSGGNNDCIKLSGVDKFHISRNNVWGCNRGEIIDMVGCHDGVITGNYFHEPVASGVQTKGGSSDVIIHGNVFADIPGRAVNAGGSTDLPFFRPIDAPHEAARIQVIGNVFLRNGAMAGAAVAFTGCDGCLFANNTILDPKTWVARILQENRAERFAPSRNGQFVNNIIVFKMADVRAFVNVSPGTAPETFTFGSNLWFASDRGSDWTGPVLGNNIPPESGSLVQRNPMIPDAANRDVRIPSDSPAHAAGRLVPGIAAPDMEGKPWASPPSIGAYEAATPQRPPAKRPRQR